MPSIIILAMSFEGEQDYQFEVFMVKGVDNRHSLTELNVYPYYCLLMIVANSNQSRIIGTAFQINELYAVTVAHNLWDSTMNRPYQSIQAYPAAFGLAQTSNSLKIEAFQIESRYLEFVSCKKNPATRKNYKTKLKQYECALIKLPKPIPRQKYIALASDSYALKAYKFQVSGYCGNTFSTQPGMIHALPKRGYGQVVNIHQGIVSHKIDTALGQSGSPIMTEDQGQYCAIGIHTCGIKAEPMNYGIEFTAERMLMVQQWARKMSKPYLHRIEELNNESIVFGLICGLWSGKMDCCR